MSLSCWKTVRSPNGLLVFSGKTHFKKKHVIFFIVCFFFIFFFSVLFSFSVVRADANTGNIVEKFFCENDHSLLGKLNFGASVDREGGNGPFEGDPAFMFFIFLFHFLKNCVSSFFFFSSFNCFSLLAQVSKLNDGCFLRCRCSMELWCLDDIGQES